jgi:hypothetical protein
MSQFYFCIEASDNWLLYSQWIHEKMLLEIDLDTEIYSLQWDAFFELLHVFF